MSDVKITIHQQRHSLNAVRPIVKSIRQRLLSERRRRSSSKETNCRIGKPPTDRPSPKRQISPAPTTQLPADHFHSPCHNSRPNIESARENYADSSHRQGTYASWLLTRQARLEDDPTAMQQLYDSDASMSRLLDEKQSPLDPRRTPITTREVNGVTRQPILCSHYSIDLPAGEDTDEDEEDPKRFHGFKYRTCSLSNYLDNPVPASIINHSDDEDAAAHIYNAYKKLSEMRERGLEADVQAITRQFPHAHRQSIYLNVEELERQRRRWSSITTGSASFATDPSGTANFFGGYVFGDLNPTLHEFSEFYAEDGDIEGNEMHQLSGPNKKLLEERRISRTDQYPSTITFGLSSFNDPPTSISQRPTTSNFLQVPGSTYTAESKRPSILSNTISTDLISTQCSHAPLVSAQQKSADKPIRLQIPARSATRRQNNPLSRFGQLILSVILWPVRLFNALQQWRADVPSVSSIRKRIGQRLLIESDKGGSPMRRLNQLQTETNFAGVVY
ncbi:hypothetical protein M3Y97_01065500 [Aphelenchoides bicaudatus]|nr:hypothetical protein M3Y97_01065500 [Aphelenchoides bicaudatus]